MTIDDLGPVVGSNSGAAQISELSRNRNASGKVWTSTDPAADHADLPRFAALVSATVNAGSQERADRVEQLRQLVSTGGYQVDSQALSRSMVDSMLKGY
jgi:anti-sigma28 factor (negative regulator of flagellin synthesis)